MGDRWAGCLGGAGVMEAVWGGDCWPYGSTWELTERGNPHSGPEWTWSETDALHHATPDPCLPMHPHPAHRQEGVKYDPAKPASKRRKRNPSQMEYTANRRLQPPR